MRSAECGIRAGRPPHSRLAIRVNPQSLRAAHEGVEGGEEEEGGERLGEEGAPVRPGGGGQPVDRGQRERWAGAVAARARQAVEERHRRGGRQRAEQVDEEAQDIVAGIVREERRDGVAEQVERHGDERLTGWEDGVDAPISRALLADDEPPGALGERQGVPLDDALGDVVERLLVDRVEVAAGGEEIEPGEEQEERQSAPALDRVVGWGDRHGVTGSCSLCRDPREAAIPRHAGGGRGTGCGGAILAKRPVCDKRSPAGAAHPRRRQPPRRERVRQAVTATPVAAPRRPRRAPASPHGHRRARRGATGGRERDRRPSPPSRKVAPTAA